MILPELLDIFNLKPAEFKKFSKNFSCSDSHLNDYLKKFAYNHSVKNGISKTYVLLKSDLIISYITLTVDTISISKNDNSYHEYKNFCKLSDSFKYTIPAIKIARLATDPKHLKNGYAAILFKYAELKGYLTQINEGCRLLTIDAKKTAIDFYHKMGCKKLSEKNEKEYTPMLFTIGTIKLLTDVKEKELLEFCKLFNLESDYQFLSKFFKI